MKYKTKQIVTALMLIILIGGLTGCGESIAPEPTIEEQQAAVLAQLTSGTASWEASSILRDDLANDSNLPNFSLSFGDGTFTTENGKHVWPDTGTWAFVDGKVDQIQRDDGVVIDLVIKEDVLTLAFELDENVYSVGGRTQTVLARYFFNLFRRR